MIALDAYARLPRFPGQGRGFQALTRLLPHASVRARHLEGARLMGPRGDLTYMFAALLRGDDLVGRTIRGYPPDATFIDIGANIGAYALLAARRFTRGRVYAVEPHPVTFGYLARNVELNGLRNVTLCCAAVDGGDQRLVALGFDAGHSGGASLVGDRRDTIDVLTISRIWFDHLPGIERALLKIDVEGAEATVVREILQSRLVPALDGILIEVSHALGDNALAAMLDDLVRAGFREVEREAGGEADDVLYRRNGAG